MFLTLIKKININIVEITNLITNSYIYINKKYIDYEYNTNIYENIDIITVLKTSEYIYIINNFIYQLKTNEKNYINKEINIKIYEIKNYIKEIINILFKKLNIEELCEYIINSNKNELYYILYIIFLSKIKNKCIINKINEKINEKNIYIQHKEIYNYDNIINGINIRKQNKGIDEKFIKNSNYINTNKNIIKINEEIINKKNYNIIKCNKLINEYIFNYYNKIELIKKEYNNNGNLIDYGKNNEIKLYNNYMRRKTYNKGINLNKKNAIQLEKSIFEVFNI